MASSIVFKVKYEETLRRFNVAIDGEQRLDLSMEGLRLKICSLFNLPSDADLRLTYKDEDNDLITIVDDEDLNDVLKQGLDPVRITVHVNSNQSAQSSSATSTRSAAPNTPSPQNVLPNVADIVKSVQETLGNVLLNSQQNTNPDVAKIMKSVHEPLSQALSKLSSDMSSKAASTNPILTDLFDGLSKMGQSCMNAALSNFGASTISSQSNVDNGSKPNSKVKKHGVSADEGVRNSVIDKGEPSQPAPKSTRATGVDASGKHPLCTPLSFDKGKNVSCESSKTKSGSCGMKKNKDITAQKYGTSASPVFLRAIPVDASEKESLRDGAERIRDSLSYHGPIPLDESPYMGVPCPPFLSHNQFLKPMHLINSLNRADNLGPIFHKGVRCDGCGVLPITGPRFKSKVKDNYDLCIICFSRIGYPFDYTRIDFPLAQGHSRPFMSPDLKTLRQCLMRPHASKHPRLRLDSRFIMDVNVMDGTIMAPSTPFIKIWRMRNNGTLPWLHGLKLLYIGGDRISPFDSVEIQVPSTGVDVGHELDIAVDFVAPELPGRYISYWRMSDSEHKFGQRVWVQIQVDQSVGLTRESSPMLNLNLPPNNEAPFPEAVDVKSEPGFIVEVGQSSAPPSNLEHNHKTEMVTMNFPTNDDLLVTGNVGYSTPASSSSSVLPPPAANPDGPRSPVARSSVSYPEVEEPSASLMSYPVVDKLAEPSAGPSDVQDVISIFQQISEKTESEEQLLKELAQMGFKEVDLNKDVLRRNEYDLERCVDDLCDVSEWDPLLDELTEMGFEDKETNKKLLVKNNGSITRVVIDLIAEENALSRYPFNQ